jgi:hypothetical protein
LEVVFEPERRGTLEKLDWKTGVEEGSHFYFGVKVVVGVTFKYEHPLAWFFPNPGPRPALWNQESLRGTSGNAQAGRETASTASLSSLLENKLQRVQGL